MGWSLCWEDEYFSMIAVRYVTFPRQLCIDKPHPHPPQAQLTHPPPPLKALKSIKDHPPSMPSHPIYFLSSPFTPSAPRTASSNCRGNVVMPTERLYLPSHAATLFPISTHPLSNTTPDTV